MCRCSTAMPKPGGGIALPYHGARCLALRSEIVHPGVLRSAVKIHGCGNGLKAIVTTGSAPMLAFILLGRLTGPAHACGSTASPIPNGCRHLAAWRVKPGGHKCIVSQWPDVAAREGVRMLGARPVIFASVGSMLPFDRFVQRGGRAGPPSQPRSARRSLSRSARGSTNPAIATVGADRSRTRNTSSNLEAECDLFVAHVGMGSILQALEAAASRCCCCPRQASPARTHHRAPAPHRRQVSRSTPGHADRRRGRRRCNVEMTRLLAEPMAGSDGIPTFAPDGFTARVAAFLHG